VWNNRFKFDSTASVIRDCQHIKQMKAKLYKNGKVQIYRAHTYFTSLGYYFAYLICLDVHLLK